MGKSAEKDEVSFYRGNSVGKPVVKLYGLPIELEQLGIIPW